MKQYKEFNDIIKNKNIVYIPIVSCINRKTGEYDLSCDGNVNRFITTFSKCHSFANLTIILPSIHVENSEHIINEFVARIPNINIIYTEHFGIHAGEQRNMDSVVNAMYRIVSNINADMYIFESQKLGKAIIENIPDKEYIFYNPVSKVTGKTRIFLEGYDEINNWLFDHADYTIVSSPDQLTFFNNSDKLIYLDKLIDRDLHIFDYEKNSEIINELNNYKEKGVKIFYLPFRLTDEGYHIDVVIKTLYDEMKDNDIHVYYSDPNNSGYLDTIEMKDELRSCFSKVSTDRNTYYTFLDFDYVTILYYEDLEFINHAAIHEFTNDKSKCHVYVMNNNNPYDIMSCDRVQVKYHKPTLIVMEGQDQIGKDTLIDALVSRDKSICRYKQQTHEETGTDCRKKDDYEAWLKDYIGEVMDNLDKMTKEYDTVVLTRLLITDNVYSDLFGRDHIVEKYYKDRIYRDYNMKTFCMLWDSYDDYIKRISKYTNEVEYQQDEFEKTKDLYKKYVDEDDIFYLKEETSIPEVIKIFDIWNESHK